MALAVGHPERLTVEEAIHFEDLVRGSTVAEQLAGGVPREQIALEVATRLDPNRTIIILVGENTPLPEGLHG